MNVRVQTQLQGTPTPSFAPVPRGQLQRQCACGTHTMDGGQCAECWKKNVGVGGRPLETKLAISEPGDVYEQETDRVTEEVISMSPVDANKKQSGSMTLPLVQRHASAGSATGLPEVPPIVNEVLNSPGKPLDDDARSFLELRFGHDFSKVRVHTDGRAVQSAQAVNALAYTVGENVVFASGQYSPQTVAGRHILAHELTHVVQQTAAPATQIAPAPVLESPRDGSYRLALAPPLKPHADHEKQADAVASRIAHWGMPVSSRSDVQSSGTKRLSIQPYRVSLPTPKPLCGKALTHIDIEPPRWRPLVPCVPPTVMVNRINIVGRDLSVPTPGRGPQIFNLHIGYYEDSATGRWCGVIDDSKTCVAPRCLTVCLPTLKEVIDWLIDQVKTLLAIIGIVLLTILVILIGRGLLRPGTGPGTVPGGVPVLAGSGGERRDKEGGGEGKETDGEGDETAEA